MFCTIKVRSKQSDNKGVYLRIYVPISLYVFDHIIEVYVDAKAINHQDSNLDEKREVGKVN
jgi:hypothetical protein